MTQMNQQIRLKNLFFQYCRDSAGNDECNLTQKRTDETIGGSLAGLEKNGWVLMVTSIELSEQELADLRDLTEQSDSTKAIQVAMRDYIRYARRMRLKQLSGQVEMIDNWMELEQSEVGDLHDDSSR